MAKVVLDTNIILDYLCAKRPCHRDAVDALEVIYEEPGCSPVVLLANIKDAYYIMCRQYRNEKLVRTRLREFTEIVDLEELTVPIAMAAFESDEPDYEDAIVRVTAEGIGARAIMTRDVDAYRGSVVPSVDAKTYLERFAME